MSTTRERRSARWRRERYAAKNRRRLLEVRRATLRERARAVLTEWRAAAAHAFRPPALVVLPLVRVVVADAETRAPVEVLRVVLECARKHRDAYDIAHRGARDCPPLCVGKAVWMALHGPVVEDVAALLWERATSPVVGSAREALRGYAVDVDPGLPPDVIEGFGA